MRSPAAATSLVTPRPSDVDLQILLARGTPWRERGNRVVDGFLIEYFANPPERIRGYFREDHAGNRRVTATMFCTGQILFARDGELVRMLAEARRWQRRPMLRLAGADLERTRYGIWDAVDNVLDAAERDAPDLPFQYHHALRVVYEGYARFLRQPLMQADRIWRAYGPRAHPEKVLLPPFPDADFVALLVRAIRESDRCRMAGRLRRLADHALARMGGFEIDGWRFRTPVRAEP